MDKAYAVCVLYIVLYVCIVLYCMNEGALNAKQQRGQISISVSVGSS